MNNNEVFKYKNLIKRNRAHYFLTYIQFVWCIYEHYIQKEFLYPLTRLAKKNWPNYPPNTFYTPRIPEKTVTLFYLNFDLIKWKNFIDKTLMKLK